MPFSEELVLQVVEYLLGGAVVDAVSLLGCTLDDSGVLQRGHRRQNTVPVG